MNWREALLSRLLTMQPASVCALDEAAYQWVVSVLPETSVSLRGNAPNASSDLAVGFQALDGLNTQKSQHLISQTRLYVAPRLLLAERADAALDADMFRALGFTLCATDAANNMNLYDYDLDTYKTVPDWLNARFWAHPERWKS